MMELLGKNSAHHGPIVLQTCDATHFPRWIDPKESPPWGGAFLLCRSCRVSKKYMKEWHRMAECWVHQSLNCRSEWCPWAVWGLQKRHSDISDNLDWLLLRKNWALKQLQRHNWLVVDAPRTQQNEFLSRKSAAFFWGNQIACETWNDIWTRK